MSAPSTSSSTTSVATAKKPIFDELASLRPLYSDSEGSTDSNCSTGTSTDASTSSSKSSTAYSGIPVNRKRLRRSPEFEKVHNSLDQMERELEVVKVKMLSCRSAHQRAMINSQVERILEKCQEMQEEVSRKRKNVN
ncbi:unnamed protein product [Bursaphelenchus xylophilus]|uniref:(pine wood nematode) hypothetical protein n=1 Tax=Bursaphelenchus xylophilus TaxID=6326 RepID=A0A1I7SEH6_BURXY|nr:unnamed protein product [Bursaphelenchus xylophilus]CAG9113499.1 unnamed protein product [Bursaphelenchus xylophilus]